MNSEPENIILVRSPAFRLEPDENSILAVGRDFAVWLMQHLASYGAHAKYTEPYAEEAAWLLDFVIDSVSFVLFVEKFWRPQLTDDWWALKVFPTLGKRRIDFLTSSNRVGVERFVNLLVDLLSTSNQFSSVTRASSAAYASFPKE